MFMFNVALFIVTQVTEILAAPPAICHAEFHWGDCGLPPMPVVYYWNKGSRCEAGIWKGCLPNPNMFLDEYECVKTCIFRVRPGLENESGVNTKVTSKTKAMTTESYIESYSHEESENRKETKPSIIHDMNNSEEDKSESKSPSSIPDGLMHPMTTSKEDQTNCIKPNRTRDTTIPDGFTHPKTTSKEDQTNSIKSNRTRDNITPDGFTHPTTTSKEDQINSIKSNRTRDNTTPDAITGSGVEMTTSKDYQTNNIIPTSSSTPKPCIKKVPRCDTVPPSGLDCHHGHYGWFYNSTRNKCEKGRIRTLCTGGYNTLEDCKHDCVK